MFFFFFLIWDCKFLFNVQKIFDGVNTDNAIYRSAIEDKFQNDKANFLEPCLKLYSYLKYIEEQYNILNVSEACKYTNS